jgi:hypothetical protein
MWFINRLLPSYQKYGKKVSLMIGINQKAIADSRSKGGHDEERAGVAFDGADGFFCKYWYISVQAFVLIGDWITEKRRRNAEKIFH